MYIKKASVEGFGKLYKKTFDFTEGIQVIYGKNETGKTTLRQFITGMLFGLEKSRGLAARTDDYTRYQPMNGGIYGGNLTFEIDGKTYRVMQRFSTEQKEFHLYDEETMEEYHTENDSVVGQLFYLDKQSFLNTVCMTQKEIRTGKEMQVLLQNAMANLYTSRDSKIDLRGAIDYLKGKRRNLRKNISFEELKFLRSSQGLYSADRKKLEQYEEEEIRLLQQIKEKPKKSLLQKFVAWIKSVFGKDTEDKIMDQKHRLELIQMEIRHLKENQKKEEELNAQYQVCYQKCQNVEEEIHQIELAIEAIKVGGRQVQKTFGDVLNQEMTKIFSSMTNGRYARVFLNESMELMVEEAEQLIPMKYLSNGTVEQLYFALRLASANLLYEEDHFPIFLDDVFGNYDDKRLGDTLVYLDKKQDRQVFLFTCRQDILEIMNQKAIDYHLITME